MALNRIRRLFFAAVIAEICVAGASPAAGQSAGQPPVQGDQSGERARAARQTLDFGVSLVELSEDERWGSGRASAAEALGRYSTMLFVNTAYRNQGRRVRVDVDAGSMLRQYNALGKIMSGNHEAGIRVVARLNGRTTLLANQSVAYLPSYLYALFPQSDAAGQAGRLVPAVNYAMTGSESLTLTTNVTAVREVSRRSRVYAGGEIDSTDFVHQVAGRPDLYSRGVSARYESSLGPNTVAEIDYQYRTGRFEYGGGVLVPNSSLVTAVHGLDVKWKHSRRLSETRRLDVALGLGSSAADVPLAGLRAAETARFYRLSAEAQVDWQLSSTWQTHGLFRRGFDYVAGLANPVFVNGFSGEFRGLVAGGLIVVASGSVAYGNSATAGPPLTFDSYAYDLRFQYPLVHALAAYAEYLYYFYDFQGDARLAPGIPPRLQRNGIRVGVTLGMRAFRR